MKVWKVASGVALLAMLWAAGSVGLRQFRLRQFESGPTPTIAFVKDVSLVSASDDGTVFGGATSRTEGIYDLSTACIYSFEGGLGRLPTDDLCDSNVIRVTADGKFEVGSISWGNGVPFDGKGGIPTFQCVWESRTLSSRIARLDSSPSVSSNGKWFAYNTYEKAVHSIPFDVAKDIRTYSESTGETVLSSDSQARASCISDDGGIVGGSISVPSKTILESGQSLAVVWNRGKLIRLTEDHSWTTACSADGTWVVGVVFAGNHLPERGFRWSAKTGFELLPEADGHDVWPSAITSDGKTIVIHSLQHTAGSKDVEWNRKTGSKDNFKAVVASENSNYHQKGYIWREGVGIIALKDYLKKRGATLKGNEEFSYPSYITPDGHTILCLSSSNWTSFNGTWIVKI